MPLIYVQRYVVQQVLFEEGGTQYVDGVLTFGNPTTIYLSNAVFGQTGDYVLFDYSDGSFPGGQSELNTNVIPNINTTDLILSGLNPAGGTAVLEDDTVNSRIILKIVSRPTNGCQYVDGVLTISNPMTVVLNGVLYKTAGTYTLFDWTGTGSFVGSATNITLTPPAGRSVASPPAVVGSTIQFTLA